MFLSLFVLTALIYILAQPAQPSVCLDPVPLVLRFLPPGPASLDLSQQSPGRRSEAQLLSHLPWDSGASIWTPTLLLVIKLSLLSPNLGFVPWWNFLLFPVPYPRSQDLHLHSAAQGTFQSKNGDDILQWKHVKSGGRRRETFLVGGFVS